MDGIRTVCAQQWRLALKDSGTLVFYACGALAIGGLLPLWPAAGPFVLNAMVLYPLFLLGQWASEAFAAEKETRTLESLLSTSVGKKQLMFGKGAFCLGAACACFCLSLLPLLILKAVAGALPDVSGGMLLAVSGLFIPIGFCLVVLLTLVSQRQAEAAVLLSAVFLVLAALVAGWVLWRLKRLDRGGLLADGSKKTVAGSGYQRDTRSQSLMVLGHEWRYFKALGRFKFSLLMFTLAPAIFMALWDYFFGGVNLYAALAVLSLGTARITVNLTAYTIGGERAYKTFESLLSTPIGTGALFLGKGLLALLFSLIISILAVLLVLVVSVFIGGTALFSPDQWLLLAAGLLFSLLMIYVTGLSTMLMKKPRQGLYMAVLLSFLAAAPALAVWLLPGSRLLWALASLILLLAADLLLAVFIHRRISREQLMRCI